MFEKTFEADPNLKYTYAWRGVNVYRQRVYGTTTALVKVTEMNDSWLKRILKCIKILSFVDLFLVNTNYLSLRVLTIIMMLIY